MPKPLLTNTGRPLSLGDSTVRASQAAPELNPSTAVTVASKGGTVTQNAQAVGHANLQTTRAKAAQQATSESGGGLLGWLGRTADNVGHDITHALSDVATDLNKPLKLVQHEYRYLHTVYERHGDEAALTEGLGLLAGAAAGTAVGVGPILGGEAAAYLEGQVAYKATWARSETGAHDRTSKTGDLISIGRTVANMLGLGPHTRTYSTLSGVVDGISDLILTPLGQAGHLVGEARSAEGAPGLLNKVWGGLRISSPEDIDRAYSQYRSVRNAFQWIADATVGDIVSRYGAKLAPIAQDLAEAGTPEEVKNVFEDAVRANEIRTTDGLISSGEDSFERRAKEYFSGNTTLPTSTVGSQAVFKLKTAAGNAREWGPLERLFGPATWSRRFTTVPGGYIDEVTGKLEKALDFRTGRGASTIWHFMRYAESPQVANTVAEAYAFADPADRVTIWKNAVVDVVHALAFNETALPEDLTSDELDQITTIETRRAFKKLLDRVTPEWGSGGHYGNDASGADTDKIYDPSTDREMHVAVLPEQIGKAPVPDFKSIVRAAKELGAAKSLFLSKADDWMYDKVTQPFWKALVLQTPSYAGHMALSEDVLNGFRQGVGKMLKGALYSSAKALGYAADGSVGADAVDAVSDADEAQFALQEYRWHGIKVPGLTQMRMHWDANLFNAQEEHITPESIAAGHGGGSYLDDSAVKATRIARSLAQKGVSLERGDRFVQYDASSPWYKDAYSLAAAEMGRSAVGNVAASAYRDALDAGMAESPALRNAANAATDYLRNEMPEEERALYTSARYFKPNFEPPAGWDELDTWGDRIARSMHGLLPRGSAEDQRGILDAMVEGRAPKLEEIDAIDSEKLPSVVKGRALEPTSRASVQRLASWGFRRVLNPMINRLSREPLFETEYWKALTDGAPKTITGAIDQDALGTGTSLLDQVERGEYTEDQAVLVARTRAANRAIKFVHNIATRTQWSETVRNWFPFAFAQEQAYKRAFRLLVADPGAFRRYQLSIQAVGHMVAELTTPTGTKVFAIPGSGLLGKGVPTLLKAVGVNTSAVTASLGGDFTAANVIFPLSTSFRPDISPLASIPAKALAGLFPETRGAVQWSIGSETLEEPIWEQVVPNSIAQRGIEILEATKYRSFADAMVQTMQALDYEQNQAMQKWIKGGRKGAAPDIVPPSDATPQERQKFVEKVRNQTRILFAMRLLLGSVSPVSPEISIQTWGLRKELTDDIKKYGSVAAGYTAFLAKNPEATPYTVSESYASQTGTPTGVKLTESAAAQAWYSANSTLIKAHPYGAAWVMPQPSTNKFSYQVYNEQLADGMRSKLAPTQFLTQLYVAAGNSAYYKNEALFESALSKATTETQKTQLYQEWTDYKRALAAASPLWAETGATSGNKANTARQALSTLLTMTEHGLIPDNTQGHAVKNLLRYYQEFEVDYIEASSGYDYASQESKVKNAWYSYLTGIKKAEPRLGPVIETVFEPALGVLNTTVPKTTGSVTATGKGTTTPTGVLAGGTPAAG